jgi:2-polyprenyl-3-methyl-5-hydroxy-6-metoxy-1,4-benzoquinol methylase
MVEKEPQYDGDFDSYRELGPVRLGPMVSGTWRNDPIRLGIKLSRYKAVAKILKGQARVLEVGCGDGWASKLVCREVQKFHASDFDLRWREFVIDSLANEPTFEEFHEFNPLNGNMALSFSAIFALDVLEHISPNHESLFLQNCIRLMEPNGIAIFGMPSLESQKYASEVSRKGHVNCQSGNDLRINLKKYFSQVLVFSFNDETLHTGFYPMAHYLLAVCFGPKPEG